MASMLSKYRTIALSFSFSYIASHYWNNLNNAIKLSKSISQFQKSISDIDVKGCSCSSYSLDAYVFIL